MSEISKKQKDKTLQKLRTIGITNEKDILNIKVSKLKEINDKEKISDLTIKDMEVIWAIQEAIKIDNVLEFLTNN